MQDLLEIYFEKFSGWHNVKNRNEKRHFLPPMPPPVAHQPNIELFFCKDGFTYSSQIVLRLPVSGASCFSPSQSILPFVSQRDARRCLVCDYSRRSWVVRRQTAVRANVRLFESVGESAFVLMPSKSCSFADSVFKQTGVIFSNIRKWTHRSKKQQDKGR